MSGCAICGAPSPAVLYELPNNVIQRCRQCGTVSRREPVAGDAAVDLYEDDAYLETPYFDALKVGVPREGEPYGVYQRALDRIEAMVPGGQLLDVGCSYGAFLEMARERGFDTTGVELSRKATDYARSRRGLDVVHGSLEAAAFPPASFEAVTLLAWGSKALDLASHVVGRPYRILAYVRKPSG